MAHNNRKPNMLPYTLKDFQKQFPDDATCLEWLRNYLYPDGIFCEACNAVTKHHRVKSRPSYSCDHCGHHVHPTAGTDPLRNLRKTDSARDGRHVQDCVAHVQADSHDA